MSDPARSGAPRGEPNEPAPRGPLVALILVVVLVVGGIWLAQHIRAASRLQDCVMAGRTNCAPVP